MKKRYINRYPNIDNFGSRLLNLYDSFGLLNDGKIDFSQVAKDLYSCKLRFFSGSDDTYQGKDINKSNQGNIKNTADTLRKHLDIISPEQISGMWLDIYCKYFHCSCDYLMGYINRPTQINTDIALQIGLSDAAIDTLRVLNDTLHVSNNNPDAIIKYYANKPDDNTRASIISALNRILNNTRNCDLLNIINMYLEQKDIANNTLAYNDMVYDANALYKTALKDNIFMELEKLKGTT